MRDYYFNNLGTNDRVFHTFESAILNLRSDLVKIDNMTDANAETYIRECDIRESNGFVYCETLDRYYIWRDEIVNPKALLKMKTAI